MSDYDNDSDSSSDCTEYDNESFRGFVEDNDVKEVKKMLENKFCPDDDNYPCLLIAVYKGYEEMVRVLINEGNYDVNDITTEGESAIREAIEFGNLNMVKLLVEEFYADLSGGNGEAPICIAAGLGKLDIVKYLVEQESDFVSDAAFEASVNDNLECLQFLFDRDDCVLSPNIIHRTARAGADKCLDFLLQCPDAKVNHKNKDGKYPLEYAIERKHLECVKVLLKHNATVTANMIWIALSGKMTEIVEVLSSTKVDWEAVPNLTDMNGNTALHFAIEMGKLEIIKKITKTATVASKPEQYYMMTNDYGLTPFMLACKIGADIGIIKYLANKTAIRCKDAKGYNALMYACRAGKQETVEYFLKKKLACKCIKTATGKTVLHKAVKSGNLEIVKLVYHESMINVADKNNKTPIMGVRNKDVLEFLLANGANIHAQDSNGNTLLHNVVEYATENGENTVYEMFQFILAKGGDVNILNNEKQSAKMLAKADRYNIPNMYKKMKQM
jgi:ankyrin repeat protein